MSLKNAKGVFILPLCWYLNTLISIFYVRDKSGDVFADISRAIFGVSILFLMIQYVEILNTMFGDFEHGMRYAYNLGWVVCWANIMVNVSFFPFVKATFEMN